MGNREPIDDGEIGLLPIFMLVLWVTCLIVGVVGFSGDRHAAQPATRPIEPPPVEMLSVDLTGDTGSQAQAGRHQAPAPAVEMENLPAPMPAVTSPGAFLEFQTLTPARSLPMAVRLILGQGEGRQPPPEYPWQAVLAGEEGTVVAQFSVDAEGRVDDAQAIVPSPWPILNRSVLRTIRHDWRFSPGPPRRYEVSIVFQIHRQ